MFGSFEPSLYLPSRIDSEQWLYDIDYDEELDDELTDLSAPLVGEEIANLKRVAEFSFEDIYSSALPTTIAANSSIWHNGITYDGIFDIEISSASQIGITEICSPKTSPIKTTTTEVCSSEVSALKCRLPQIDTTSSRANQESIFKNASVQLSTSKVSSAEISTIQRSIEYHSPFQFSPDEISIIQTGILQERTTQISTNQISTTEVDTRQTSFTKINTSQFNASQFGITEVNPTKVSLPIGISLQQLISSYPHLYTSALTNTYKLISCTCSNEACGGRL
jgi:hypothetical protein